MLCKKCKAEMNGNSKYCSECGTPVKGVSKHREKRPKRNKHHNKSKQWNPKQPEKQSKRNPHSQDANQAGYDGYYENRQPTDQGSVINEGLDKTTLKRIALIIGGAAAVVVICIVLMQVL